MSEKRYKDQSEKTANYYDTFQHGYNEIYGDMIQAFRPTDTDELMKAIVSGADLYEGLWVLDAGCGIGGPAIWLASKLNMQISGVTISAMQVAEAQSKIKAADVSDRVQIIKGDYHQLSDLFKDHLFDRVLFLESLGHSGEPDKVISEAFAVTKPGGTIYIKDFYYKEPNNRDFAQRISKVIANIDKAYSYNTLNLPDTIRSLRAAGFEIEFIRKFNFKDDISIRFEFEKKFGIDIFDGEPEFAPAEWLEIKCIKPFQP